MNTYKILKSDVLYTKYDEFFKYLVWEDRVATVTAQRETDTHIVTTIPIVVDGATKFLELPKEICYIYDPAKRAALIAEREELMKIVRAEQESNRKYGVKHLSREARKVADKCWALDDQIQRLTF